MLKPLVPERAWLKPLEKAETFLVRGSAKLVCDDGSETVSLDIHPRPALDDTPEDHVRAAAHETVDTILDAWRHIEGGRAEALLRSAADLQGAQKGDEAEESFARAVLLLGFVPGPSADYFEERYGLRVADLVRCLPDAFTP